LSATLNSDVHHESTVGVTVTT